jgi:glutathione S-transferase
MKLYFSPLACSLATRIALYEAGAEAHYVQVDRRTRSTASYRRVHPLGLVPALELEGGEILTENAAILQFVAGRYPAARLAPEDPWERARLQQWLSFIGTELHKVVYLPLLDRTRPAEARTQGL